MRIELRYGKAKYISFIILDVLCLLLANVLASWLYLNHTETGGYTYTQYSPVVLIMVVIDILVTALLNTLCRVLRRGTQREIKEGIKHISVSFVLLAVVLFFLRAGAAYSRVTVFLAYTFYFLFFVGSHIVWKRVLQSLRKRPERKTAILMTTDRFVDEGIDQLEKLHIDVKNIWLLKNLDIKTIKDIDVVGTYEEAASVICWKMLDKVYIYGLDHHMVPGYLLKACREMRLKFNLVDFNYRIIEIKTIENKDPAMGALSFLEGKRDIPFPIRRVYWITKTEAERRRGFHAHKLNCQLLFCPYGVIDIILDDGQKRTTVTLDRPGKGLLLMPGLWREMVWKQSDSVLCVLASEYYEAKEYIRDYDEFIEYNSRYRDLADPLKESAAPETVPAESVSRETVSVS